MAEKKRFNTSLERLVILGLLVVMISMVGGFAIAAASIPAQNGIVRFCQDKKTGDARIVLPSAACATGENKVQMRSYDPIGVEYNGILDFPVSGTARHVTDVVRQATGKYLVKFDRDVSHCLASVTFGFYTASWTSATGHDPNEPDQLLVFTYDSASKVNDDAYFDLVMTC